MEGMGPSHGSLYRAAVAPVPAAGEPEARAAGRPRDEALDERILHEALVEFAARGIAGFNLVAVARRAGVAKNSVYLRWPRREDLIRAALLRGRHAELPPITGDLERDLTALAEEFATIFETPTGLAAYYQLSVAMQADPEVHEWGMESVIRPAHAIPEQVIAAAQARGAADPSVDPVVAARMLVGAIYAEAIQPPHGSVSAGFRREVVRNMLQLLTNGR
jgi:AcrR family transcriptional regulator